MNTDGRSALIWPDVIREFSDRFARFRIEIPNIRRHCGTCAVILILRTKKRLPTIDRVSCLKIISSYGGKRTKLLLTPDRAIFVKNRHEVNELKWAVPKGQTDANRRRDWSFDVNDEHRKGHADSRMPEKPSFDTGRPLQLRKYARRMCIQPETLIVWVLFWAGIGNFETPIIPC